MSISRRIFNLAKTELNSLLDKAAKWDGDDDGGGYELGDDAPLRRPGGNVRLEDLTDAELAAEIERRQRERGSTGARPEPPRSHEQARRSPPPPRPPTQAHALAKAYAALEVPAGSDFETVRKAYRALMRKYHPDKHAGSPQKQKAATELAQRLTESYTLLEKHLRK